jgi:hypothetical protein
MVIKGKRALAFSGGHFAQIEPADPVEYGGCACDLCGEPISAGAAWVRPRFSSEQLLVCLTCARGGAIPIFAGTLQKPIGAEFLSEDEVDLESPDDRRAGDDLGSEEQELRGSKCSSRCGWCGACS